MKKKIIFISTIMIIIIILISTILFIYMKKNNKENNTENSNVYDCLSYFIYSKESDKDEFLDNINLIFAFNEKDICVDFRAVWNFNNEEVAKRTYDQWKDIFSNVEINSTKVSYNQKGGEGIEVIGKTKEEIRNNKFKSYDLVEY